jgi:hypothetical protein
VRPKRPWPTSEINDRACTPTICRLNDRACTPMIYWLSNRQALCLTTITTAAGTVLLPKQTFAAFTCSTMLTFGCSTCSWPPFNCRCFACSRPTLTVLPAANWQLAALPVAILTPYCSTRSKQTHLTALLQHHKHKERTASSGMYRLRLYSYICPKRL